MTVRQGSDSAGWILGPVALLWTLLPGPVAAANDSLQLEGWDDQIRLQEPDDLNPDPKIVEINMDARVAMVEIAPGLTVEAWTYNGTIPGPLIRVRVGDRLIVHYTNNLPRPSTIHWHGLRVPIEMDGVPGYSQPPVEPGTSFTYDFIVPDAGIYWYHPHVMSAAQVGFGLYGASSKIPLRTSPSASPTRWIFHCHILDHAEGGLLSAVHLDLPISEFKNMLEP